MEKKRNAGAVLKYAATGIGAWVIDNGLFSLLKAVFGVKTLCSVAGQPLTTTALFTGISMIVGFVFSFLSNRNWTFRSEGRMTRQFIRCVLLLLFNTLITAFVVNLSAASSLTFLPDIVKYGMSGVTGVWNYFFYKHWVYAS